MKVMFFSMHEFEKPYYASKENSDFIFYCEQLNLNTVHLINNCKAISCFTHDVLDKPVLTQLKKQGLEFIALRAAGFNNVDLKAAKELNIMIARVPKYSPHAIAEHACALILALNRKIPRAYLRVRENNFSLEGLKGFDLYGKTVGVIGVGNIGSVFCQIMKGFGCKVIAYDPVQEYAVEYVTKEKLLAESDIISLHCPLNDSTRHMIDAQAISQMKNGVMLINTSRGAVVDTKALIYALKKQKIGYLGLDVYEEEEHLFFEDRSQDIIPDDVFARLQTFPNVLITAHQGFFTHEALTNIANTTAENLKAYEQQSGKYHKLV
jgi:D-lactate dehydrogenase